jgi:MerR family transcriptional regulator, thiopeptide resistance regulator
LREAREPSVDQLIQAMEAMMTTKNFSAEQFAELEQRHVEAGDAGLTHWRDRMAVLAVRAAEHVERGTDPASPDVQELAEEWHAAVTEMIGDDRNLLSALYAKIDRQGAETATKGILTTAAWEYLKQAFAAGFRPRPDSTETGVSADPRAR